MVVQRNVKPEPSAFGLAADDNNKAKGVPLFLPDFLEPKLQSSSAPAVNLLASSFKKLQDLVESLPEPNMKMRASLQSTGCRLRLRAITVNRCLHLFYGGTSDVFATSVGILDKFMSLVRVQEKYLTCVAAACYFISAKYHLEEEEVPTASELAKLHGNKWTSSDLCRLELIVLKKLSWDIPKTNYLTFLRLFEDIFAKINEGLPFGYLDGQICLAERLIRLDDSLLFKPSTLAFCVLNHQMEQQDLIDSHMRNFLIHVQLVCDIQDSELFECKDLLCQSMDEVMNSNQNQRKLSPYFPFKIRSRPSSEGESELPSISEVTAY